MAAVKRRSGGGIVVALVFFVVLAFVGIGGSIWFYQQATLAQNAIKKNEQYFKDNIEKIATEAEWTFKVGERTQLGVTINNDTFLDVASKLEVAMAFEKQWESLLGGTNKPTLESFQNAIANAAVEVPAGQDNVISLLGIFQSSYNASVDKAANAERARADFERKYEGLKKTYADKVKEHLTKYNALEAKHEAALTALRVGNAKLTKSFDGERSTRAGQEKKFKELEAANAREKTGLLTKISALEATIARLKKIKEYTEKEEFVQDGRVVKTSRNFTAVSGGKDVDMQPNTVLVVYSMEGLKPVKMMLLRVSRVHDFVSQAHAIPDDGETLADMNAKAPLLGGEPYVTLSKWQRLFPGQ